MLLFPPRKETGRRICDVLPNEYAKIFRLFKGISTTTSFDVSELPECSTMGIPTYGLNCGAGRSSFNVSWDGFLTACDNLNSLKVSLLENSFSDAWNQVHPDALSFPLPMECSNCAYDKVCFSCAAYRGLQAEKGHCNPKICERTKLFVKEGIYKL